MITAEVNSGITKTPVVGYSRQRLCKTVLRNGTPCKCIALRDSEHCRHHSYAPKVTHVEAALETSRYKIPDAYKQSLVDKNFTAKNIFDLRSEIALMQANLQKLIESPIQNLPATIALTEQIRKLIETAKKIESEEKYFAQSNKTISIVLARIQVIIAKHCDKNTKTAIAQELFEIGKTWTTPAVDIPALSAAPDLKSESQGIELKMGLGYQVSLSEPKISNTPIGDTPLENSSPKNISSEISIETLKIEETKGSCETKGQERSE